ncbi:unnamed protein product [Absidia cylindrospora]
MTSDSPVDQLDRDVSQKEPFQVVLIDIKETYKKKEIHCVKKPLDDNDLTFVALSYRWGELHETLVDTGVGYTASITSFALEDFYKLCYMMTIESDTKDIPYVWVDAICVDQQNPVRRKETIYQMSNIYDKASYILAVPDLHMTYLKGLTTKHYDTIMHSKKYYKDLYFLLHKNTTAFAAQDQDFLDDFIPNDPPELKQLLFDHTDHFGPSFMTFQDHDRRYCPMLALDHICRPAHHWKDWIKSSSKYSIDNVHQCREAVCPLALRNVIPEMSVDDERQLELSKWKSRMIERSTAIRQSMELMADLVVDWSSRVWVISEFSIAKRKNNLKYWFAQLSLTNDGNDYVENHVSYYFLQYGFSFFNFDFDAKLMDAPYYADEDASRLTRSESTNPIYIRFHYTMTRQLSQQTFLQMMLGSKASRNEDRFHSVLPLSEYREKKIEVSHWDIHGMLSVKLKLYEIMNNKDKVILLFWSTYLEVIRNNVLPTFATTTLPSVYPTECLLYILDNNRFSNVDLDDPCALMLHHHNDDDQSQYYLRFKPKEYYVINSKKYRFGTYLPRCQRIGIPQASTLSLIAIPAYQEGYKSPSKYTFFNRIYLIILVGCAATNKWTVFFDLDYNYQHHDQDRRVIGKDVSSLPFLDIY